MRASLHSVCTELVCGGHCSDVRKQTVLYIWGRLRLTIVVPGRDSDVTLGRLGMFNLFFGGQRYEISVIIAQKHAKSADFGIKIAIISEIIINFAARNKYQTK